MDQNVLYVAMQLMGPSLKDLFNACGKQFSLKTTLMLFLQLLDRVEYCHEKLVMHRDLKPDNIMVGTKDLSSYLYLIDFGLARSVIDPKTNKHIEFQPV